MSMHLPGNCKKCGVLFDTFDHAYYDGDEGCTCPYEICRSCNDVFWNKYYALPKVQMVNGKPVFTLEHFKLIEEYHKVNFFINR
jgi:hypothetical protein